MSDAAFKLPNFCFACAAPLAGSLTRHAANCPIRKLIAEQFPGYPQPEPDPAQAVLIPVHPDGALDRFLGGDSPLRKALGERAAHLEEYSWSIGARVFLDGRWQNLYLSEMPGRAAVAEAFRLLLEPGIPHRRVREGEKP